ncbi:MAG: hypothetical protein HQL93_02860 [Magnetococcales bacterium]|nr:hypothetical protein [Magnetococcales bacterium]
MKYLGWQWISRMTAMLGLLLVMAGCATTTETAQEPSKPPLENVAQVQKSDIPIVQEGLSDKKCANHEMKEEKSCQKCGKKMKCCAQEMTEEKVCSKCGKKMKCCAKEMEEEKVCQKCGKKKTQEGKTDKKCNMPEMK